MEVVCRTYRMYHGMAIGLFIETLNLIGLRQSETLPVFHPEFGRFMLEATPGKPWGIGFKDLLDVEPNMKLRCVLLPSLLSNND